MGFEISHTRINEAPSNMGVVFDCECGFDVVSAYISGNLTSREIGLRGVF